MTERYTTQHAASMATSGTQWTVWMWKLSIHLCYVLNNSPLMKDIAMVCAIVSFSKFCINGNRLPAKMGFIHLSSIFVKWPSDHSDCGTNIINHFEKCRDKLLPEQRPVFSFQVTWMCNIDWTLNCGTHSSEMSDNIKKKASSKKNVWCK